MRKPPAAHKLIIGMALLGSAIPLAAAQPLPVTTVEIPRTGTPSGALTGHLFRPAGDGSAAAPAIVAMHGCGGLFTRDGKAIQGRNIDWARRWTQAGYVVLFPDSFRPRGVERVCEQPLKAAIPIERAKDATAAADWLAAQPFVDKGRLALVGWSHGGSTALWAISKGYAPVQADFKTAIAFYPGCRFPRERAAWPPRAPTTILMGAADDWTPPEECHSLVKKVPSIRYVEYPDALHAFDSPNLPRTTLKGVAFSKRGDGTVELGTDPVARAAAIAEVTKLLAEAFRAP